MLAKDKRILNYCIAQVYREETVLPKDVEKVLEKFEIEYNLYELPKYIKDDLICFKNGVFNLETNEFGNFSPTYGFTSMVNFSYNPAIKQTPFFDIYCDNAFNGDERCVQLLLEIIAVSLTNKKLKKFFVLCGDTNTGKSVMLDFLQELVGIEFCESVSNLNSFDGKWSTSNLVGKKLCICADNNNTMLSSSAMSTIKQIVSSDRVMVEEKFKTPYTGIVDPTLIIASNYGINVKSSELEEAFVKRIVVLPFMNTVPEHKQIRNLKDRLYEETDSIITRALNAYRKLAQRNFVFTQVIDSTQIINNPKGYLKSTVARFIDAVCDNGDGEITTDDLYKAYNSYCVDIEEHPLEKNAFSKEFNSLTTYERVKRVKGTDLRGYTGINIII